MGRKLLKKLKVYEEAKMATNGPLRRKPVRKLQHFCFTWNTAVLTVGGSPLPDRTERGAYLKTCQLNKYEAENLYVGLWVSRFIGLAIKIFTVCKSYKKLETPTDVPKWKC